MVSSLLNVSLWKPFSAAVIYHNKSNIPSDISQEKKFPSHVSSHITPEQPKFIKKGKHCSPVLLTMFHQSVIPLAACAILVYSNPAHAGFLSGSTGIESIPGPDLPKIDFLSRFNEDNQKKYAENDARFKESPILKQLLEQSKLNKEKNKQAIADKYCLRGAEWGVGDCSAEGMSPEERDKFIAMLKEKVGVE